jgi:hypothetical protein
MHRPRRCTVVVGYAHCYPKLRYTALSSSSFNPIQSSKLSVMSVRRPLELGWSSSLSSRPQPASQDIQPELVSRRVSEERADPNAQLVPPYLNGLPMQWSQAWSDDVEKWFRETLQTPAGQAKILRLRDRRAERLVSVMQLVRLMVSKVHLP